MPQEINIFLDPPTQAEIDEAFRQDSVRIGVGRTRDLTLGRKIAFGPGVLGLEVLVGAAVEAFNGKPRQNESSTSAWEAWPGALDWDWNNSLFTESYANKVRTMGRHLVRCEVTALAHQLSVERDATSAIRQAVSGLKEVGTMAGNIANTVGSNFLRKK